MGMSVGPAMVALVEFGHGSVYSEAYKNRLAMVLDVINNGGIGTNLGLPSIDEIGYGSKGHVQALDAIEEQLRATRAAIAELNARESCEHDWRWEHNGGDSWRVCRTCGTEDTETPFEGEA